MDHSGGANPARQYLVTMSGDNLSPSPHASSPIMFANNDRSTHSLLDTVKRDDK
jgi:hypothetical protein